MGDPCQVDFYVLADAGKSPEQVACWLAVKAWEQGHRVAVRTSDDAAARSLDEMMWDFPPGRFLPHTREQDMSSAPVRIGTTGDAFDDERPVLVNLDESSVPEPRRFTRLLEIVPANTEHRTASRRKYVEYRDLGLEPSSHSL